MALVTEDGTGLSNAESYISVADADTYHLARGREATWFDLDQDVKENALRLATDYMLQVYRPMWRGYRVTATQSLDWPRYDVPIEDVTGGSYKAYYLNNVVPDLVKRACAELALKTIAGTNLAPDLAPPVTSKKVDAITITYAAGARQLTRFQVADNFLATLLKTGSGSMGVVTRG